LPISLDINIDFGIKGSSTPVAFQATETILENNIESKFVQSKQKRGRPTITSILQYPAQESQDI
jgi:hypothetical protein